MEDIYAEMYEELTRKLGTTDGKIIHRELVSQTETKRLKDTPRVSSMKKVESPSPPKPRASVTPQADEFSSPEPSEDENEPKVPPL